MKPWSRLFLLWTLQGFIAAAWLVLLPTDTDKGVIFGFSAARLILFGGQITLTGVSAFLAWFSPRSTFVIPQNYYKPLYLVSICAALLSPLTIVVLNGLGKTSGYIFSAYAGRLLPLAFWLTLSSVELAIFLARRLTFQKIPQTLYKPLGFVMVILVLLAGFISITRVGIVRYNDGSWGAPATPLLEWQIFLVLLASLVFLAMETRWRWLQSDRFMGLFIYGVTCLLWLSKPVNPGFFATSPRAPNFEIYPFSDALIYAQYAQSALVGNGFMWPDVPTRPLYIAFITWLHVLAGQDYNRIIILQTLVLALFPVVLYFLGKELGGRSLGLGLALLAVLRDITANVAAPFALNYTYTKLFFSEIPTALVISFFLLLALRWIKQPKPFWYPLLAGGLLGLGALIRLQSAVILAAVIPISFFIIPNKKRWLTGCVLIVFGLGLALIPWLARNLIATGGIVLDNPISQTMTLARRWSGDNGNELIPRLSGEGDSQYSSRMTALALASLRAAPGRILGSAANHFINNEIGNLLIFPLRDQLNSPAELVWPEHAFWQNWEGQPSPGQLLVIAVYLGLFALGLAAAWRMNGLIGLLPLSLSLVYNAWTALFLSSGDRFLVPVDWAVYIYHFLGLFTLGRWIVGAGFQDKIVNYSLDIVLEKSPFAWKKTVLTAVLIIFLGASVPLTELVFPKKYNAVQATTGSEISLRGRAVYPRWYAAGDGEPGSAKLGYGAVDEARLVFFLVGEKNMLVILPLKKAPNFFPNSGDVVIDATLQDGFLSAHKVIIEKDSKVSEYMP